MTVVNPKSISGITSITTASGSDNLLTIHTSDANNTERLRIDNTGTTKIVTGIVTTLSVTGNVDIADTILHTGDTNTKIRFPAADTVTVETGGSEAIRVDSSQNFGVGTNSPTARFDVRRGDTDGKIAEFHQSTGYGIDIGSSQADAYISSGYNQNFIFKTDPTSGQTERLRISSTGQLSVATTADVTGANVAIAGSMRLVNATGQSSTISALPSGSYITGHSGGSAIVFHRFSDGGGGSDEIAFETHHQGNRHAESLRIEKTGNIKVNVGDLYFATAGKGIDFAAETPSGAGSANTVLDDYEEGTFTMTMTASSSGTIALTSSIDSLRYTKIGNLVTIHGRIRVESVSSPAGGLQIGGLPFASIASNSNSQDGYQHFGVNTHGVNFHDSTVQLFGELAPSATGAGLFQMFDNSNWGIMSADLIQGNQNEYFGFNFFYHTAT